MGCIQSKELVPEDRRKGIGHTERIHRREPTKKEGTKPTPQSFSSEIKEVDKVTPKLDENGHLLEEEVSNRRCSSEKALSVMVGNEEKILVHYAHLSQRGYYPDGEQLTPFIIVVHLPKKRFVMKFVIHQFPMNSFFFMYD